MAHGSGTMPGRARRKQRRPSIHSIYSEGNAEQVPLSLGRATLCFLTTTAALGEPALAETTTLLFGVTTPDT